MESDEFLHLLDVIPMAVNSKVLWSLFSETKVLGSHPGSSKSRPTSKSINERSS